VKITLTKDALCGKIQIPGGEYMVALASDSSTMILTGGGKQFKLPALKRRATAKSRVTTVMFYNGGGTTWSLIVSTPKHGEWISMMEYVLGREQKRK